MTDIRIEFKTGAEAKTASDGDATRFGNLASFKYFQGKDYKVEIRNLPTIIEQSNLKEYFKKSISGYSHHEWKKVFNSKVRNTKKDYWNSICQNPSLDEVFKTVRRVSKRNINNIVGIKNKDTIYCNNKEAGNQICKFFSKCGSNLNFRYINERKTGNEIKEAFEILNKDISKKEMKLIIKNMNLKKAEGPDEITPFMVKYGGEKVVYVLKKIL